ncbi:uracil-xanthine permease [Gorgonomyces haynaldii]|nr:uracil-xanthine permease [Gorgonomyces haynaldii]
MAYFPTYKYVEGTPVGIEERQSWPLVLIMGFQHLIAVFGGTVLMPILMGFNPNTTILFGGIGSLIFYIVTGGRVPSYLGSSAAFLGVVISATGYSGKGLNPNIDVALGGIFVTGCVYLVIAVIVQFGGNKLIQSILPPIVTGSIVLSIGIALGPVALSQIKATPEGYWQAIVTALTVALVSVFGRGVFQRIPFLIGAIVGYVVTVLAGINDPSIRPDMTGVNAADAFGAPPITFPKFEARSITLMVPVVVVFVAENIGHVKAIGQMSHTNLDAYIGRALAGDAIATIVASCFGGTGVTTYAENIAVLAVTRVYSTLNFVFTCLFAIFIAFIPKLGAFLFTIPPGVLGGLSVILFGTIAATGARIWAENNVDFGDTRNLIIMSTTISLAAGLNSAPPVHIGAAEFDALGLSSIVCVLLYLFLVRLPEAFFPKAFAPELQSIDVTDKP